MSSAGDSAGVYQRNRKVFSLAGGVGAMLTGTLHALFYYIFSLIVKYPKVSCL